MFVGEDVDDLLDELGGRHVVSVLGGTDQVVAHFLLVALLGRVLSAVRLEETNGGVKLLNSSGAPPKSLLHSRSRQMAYHLYLAQSTLTPKHIKTKN